MYKIWFVFGITKNHTFSIVFLNMIAFLNEHAND